jgi:hypothetical protein
VGSAAWAAQGSSASAAIAAREDGAARKDRDRGRDSRRMVQSVQKIRDLLILIAK